MGKNYLIWLDILGFERLAIDISKITSLTERKIRNDFINIIKNVIKEIEISGEIKGKNYGERDDWILIANSLDSVFKIISKVLNHNTQYKNYEKIPLEIVIGDGDFDEWAKFNGQNLVIENSAIKFLKTNIINYYHKWYKSNHNNRSPNSSYVLLTESVFHGLEPLDKNICEKIKIKYNIYNKEEIIFYIANINKIKERGKVLEFLELINQPGNKFYDRINELYIPPNEYDDIKKDLQNNQLIFITGTPGYGKTYTAVRLLWEYFIKGYYPIWREGTEESERKILRKNLEEIEKNLKPNRIIYFEDPFGKSRYESRESLERNIGIIIDIIQNIPNVYVIITSREEVFKAFEEEKLSLKQIKNFEKKLNIKKPSYNYYKRIQMLFRWATAKDCTWLTYDNLFHNISNILENKTKLPTPLSIRDFVISSRYITDEFKLLKKLEDKSIETSKSFAKEIENFTNDKLLFLTFFFICTGSLPYSFIKTEYEKFIKKLDIKDPWEFDRILNWFKDDKIVIIGDKIRFSHPSYFDALEHLLVKGKWPTRFNKEIFSKILVYFSEGYMAKKSFFSPFFDVLVFREWYIEWIFTKLPLSVRLELINNLIHKNALDYWDGYQWGTICSECLRKGEWINTFHDPFFNETICPRCGIVIRPSRHLSRTMN
ncbi:MAG: hypothetical protein HWN67_16715 [Candidatus Helarchaeota archaeon]|nr:hypothetical protein [Candidatus Helarchaeota archaeon]